MSGLSLFGGENWKTMLIVYGFIRQHIEHQIFVPLDIKSLTISFIGYHFNQYYGQYIWNICDHKLLAQVINAPPKHCILSSEFEMASLRFRIQAFPNGFKASDRGSFTLCLELLSEPIHGNEIIICRKLHCAESLSSYTKITTYKKNKAYGWPDHCLSTQEINSIIHDKHLTFVIEIEIIRIINEFGHCVYEHTMCFDHIPFEQQSFEWRIDGMLIHKMKHCYPGKRFESNIFNKMWCIRVAPNGHKEQWRDFFMIYLQIVCFPRNVSKLTVNWKVRIPHFAIQTEKTKDFKFDQNKRHWNSKKILSFEEFKQAESMVIYIDIHILDMFDNMGHKIAHQDWAKYIQPNKPQSIHVMDNINDRLSVIDTKA